jgi:hypothetical protein
MPKPARWLSAINAVVLSQALDISNKRCLLRLNSENKKIDRSPATRFPGFQKLLHHWASGVGVPKHILILQIVSKPIICGYSCKFYSQWVMNSLGDGQNMSSHYRMRDAEQHKD